MSDGKVHLPEQEMHTMAFWFAFAETSRKS
jgi:hypothetical protein